MDAYYASQQNTSFASQQFVPRDGPHPNEIFEREESYETDSASDIDEDDPALMTICMPESIYCDIIITTARGHVGEISSSLVLTCMCLALQVLLADTMAGQLASDGGQLFGMVNVTGMDEYPGMARWDENSLFDIWSISENKGNSCDMGVKKKWWACNGLSWSYEADAADAMGSYFGTNFVDQWLGQFQSFPTGYLFGGIALFLWMGYQVMEVKSICNYGQLLFLPSQADSRTLPGESRDAQSPRALSSRDRPAKNYAYDKKKGVGYLCSLNLFSKFFVFVVMVCRFYICSRLTFYGAKFLCYTNELPDFLLNSVALVFVYDIDELFFTVFLSSRKQRRISTLEPPQVHGVARVFHKWTSGTIGEVIGIIATCFVTWYFASRYLVYYANAYLTAFGNMCGEPLQMDGYDVMPFGAFTCRDDSFSPDDILRGPGGGGPPPQTMR